MALWLALPVQRPAVPPPRAVEPLAPAGTGKSFAEAAPSPPPARKPPASDPPARAKAAAPRRATALVKLTHWTREGKLTLLVDGTPVLEQSFSKGAAPFRTHTWTASVPAGRHRVSARIVGGKGKVFEAESITATFLPDITREVRLKLGSTLSLR